MTDTPEDRNNPEKESDKPTPEGSSEPAADESAGSAGTESEKDTEVIAAGQEEPAEEAEVRHDEAPSLTSASADSDEPTRSGFFNLGRTGRRIAVGAAVVAAFFSGMILYGALDDHDSDDGRPELVSAPDGESGMPGMPPGGAPGMPGGGPGGFHGGGPGGSHDGDDDGGYESDDGEHEGDEDGDGDHEGDDDRGEYEDESEEGMMPPGYQAPPGGQNQPAPMGSGQS